MSKKQKMKLEIDKPIVFFDLESTGQSTVRDKIISIAVFKIFPDGKSEKKHILVNPGVPIPAAATEINKITDEMVKDKPPFSQYSKAISEFFAGCNIGGFNCSRFDIPLLSEELSRCGINFPELETKVVDVCTIFHKKEPRNLSAGYKFYVGQEMQNAHDAEADIAATVDIFFKQLERYDDLKDFNSVVEFCKIDNRIDLAGKILKDAEGDYIYSFGKNKDVKVKVDPSYALWMLTADFPVNTKAVVTKILSELNVKIPSYQ